MKPATRHTNRWIAAAMLFLLAGSVIAWWLWPRTQPPPSLQSPPVELARFAGTEQFKQLPTAQQEPYVRLLRQRRLEIVEAVRTGQITRDDAQRIFENSFSAGVLIYAKEYRTLPPQQKQAFLDKVIAETEPQMGGALSRMFRWNRSGQGPSPIPPPETSLGGMPRPDWFDPARIKNRVEKMTPMERAETSEFLADMRKRRKERGLPTEPR